MNKFRIAAVALLLLLCDVPAAAQSYFNGPSAYLRAGDSPFVKQNGNPLFFGASNVILEDFEDGLLNTPGVAGTGVVLSGPMTDSVDEDDGAVDGSGSAGKSYGSPPGAEPSIDITFSPIFNGLYPSHVGIVWTDGDPQFEPIPVVVEFWGPSGLWLGSYTGSYGDGSAAGETAEDRFFGMATVTGIERIRIRNNVAMTGIGIEVDHLQYGMGLIHKYCQFKWSSAGCFNPLTTTALTEQPVSGDNDYAVMATKVQDLTNGLLFVGTSGKASVPFGGGTLCIQPPLKRGPVMSSGGFQPDGCNGSFTTIVNDGSLIPNGLDPGPGGSAWYQYWYRDPGNGPGGLGIALSGGMQLDFQ